MDENEKREFIKYILAAPLNILISDYKSSDRERKQELIIFCSALLKRFKNIKVRAHHVNKLNTFIRLTTGLVKIRPKPSVEDDSASISGPNGEQY